MYDSSTRIKHTRPVNMADARALENIGEDVFKEGLKYLKKTVKFAVVILKSCNGVKSNPFSKADCEFEFFKQEEKTIAIPFHFLFDNGMNFLRDMDMVKQGKKKIGTLEHQERNALLCLADFFNTKGKGI